jgi:hypothetical protein
LRLGSFSRDRSRFREQFRDSSREIEWLDG